MIQYIEYGIGWFALILICYVIYSFLNASDADVLRNLMKLIALLLIVAAICFHL